MRFMKSKLALLAAVAVLAAVAILALTQWPMRTSDTETALADPAIIFDLGGKFDKSFNEAAFNGAKRWADETGGAFREIELQNEAQREQALRRFAEAGSNPIVMAGFAFGNALGEVAGEYPDTSFRHHRHGRGCAKRAVCRVQRTRRVLPCGDDGGPWRLNPALLALSAAWTSR